MLTALQCSASFQNQTCPSKNASLQETIELSRLRRVTIEKMERVKNVPDCDKATKVPCWLSKALAIFQLFWPPAAAAAFFKGKLLSALKSEMQTGPQSNSDVP